MKKIIFSAAVLVGTVAFAQTGRVGVNTTTPVRTLDIEGDLRVKTVTDKSADAAYTNVIVQNPTTGLVDAVPKSYFAPASALKTEPWNVQSTTTEATLNSQNIYQSGSVAIGRNAVNTNAKVHIQGPGTKGAPWGAQLLLSDDFAATSNAILGFNNSGTYVNFMGLDRGSSNFYITGANGDALRNKITDAALVISGVNDSGFGGFVGLNVGNPTERLDVNGNGRIRGLVDGSAFPNIVVADANGVLGKTTAASISSAAEPWYNSATKTQATGNSQKIYQRNSVSIGDIYNTVNPVGEGLNINIGTSASGINPSNYAKGWIITHNAIPGGYLENTGGPAGQRVMKDWMEVNTPTSSTARNTYNWQRVADDVQSSTGTILKVDMGNGFVGLGQFINNGTLDQVVPSQQLDVIGNARIRALSDGSAYQNVVVADANGVLGKKTVAEIKKNSLGFGDSTTPVNLSAVAANDIKDMYVIDGGLGQVTITMPPVTASYEGKEIVFYTWGGATNAKFVGAINNSTTNPSLPMTVPSGWTYSGTFPTTELVITGANNRLNKISVFCIAGQWFFDHSIRR